MDEHEQNVAEQGKWKRRVREAANDVPENMKRFVGGEQRELLATIANDDMPITIQGIPVKHLDTAVNAMLKVMAQQEEGSPAYMLLDDAQAGFTLLLDTYMPGVGDALGALYHYYLWQAQQEQKL